jgi:hypothetical protein
MPNRVTGLLVSHHDLHQVEVTLRANVAANAVEREIASFWKDLIFLVSFKSLHPRVMHLFARRLFHGLPQRVARRLEKHLRGIARWSGHQTGQILRRSLPTDYLRAAALHKIGVEANSRGAGSVLEDEGPAPVSTGIIALVLRALGLGPTDYLDQFREPARAEMSHEEQRRIFERLLFPPPSKDWVEHLLGVTLQRQPWYQALNGSFRAAEFGPDRLAGIIAAGYSSGKSQAEITEDVRPFVDGVKWRAARVARTYGLAVAGQAQREMHAQLGELEIGKMVRATLDERTRPKHRLRSGTVYYKEPKGGQFGYDAMPEPPLEADGTLAYNCRCFSGPRHRAAVVGPRREQDGGLPECSTPSYSRSQCVLRVV